MRWQDITGWFDEANYEMFKSLKLSKNPTILECGTYYGRSTNVLKELWPDAEIHTCDPVDYDSKSIPEDVTYYNETGQRLNWNKKLDLLFIDSSHLYNDTKELFDKYSPFIKDGGYIVFHDYQFEHSEVDGVRDFVNQRITYGDNVTLFKEGEYGGAVWKK